MYGEDYTTYKIHTEFGNELVRLVVSQYINGGEGIYVGVENFVDGEWEDYAEVTTNVEYVPFVTLDVGHVSDSAKKTYLAPVIELMEKEGLGQVADIGVRRGYEQYDIAHFTPKLLENALIINKDFVNDYRFDMTYPDIADKVRESLDRAKRTETIKDMNEASEAIHERDAQEEQNSLS